MRSDKKGTNCMVIARLWGKTTGKNTTAKPPNPTGETETNTPRHIGKRDTATR
jgi:hypothetical protein